MKNYILFLLSFVAIQSIAQNVIDTAYMKCQYKYTYLKDTILRKPGDDILVLQIGQNVSKCFSHYSAEIDSLYDLPNYDEILRQKINHAFATNTDYPHKRMKAYIYKNYPKGKMTVTDGVAQQDYIYEDSLDLQNWEMKDSVRTIMGYITQMAECDFRGRHWIAWFAEDIPVNNGPWKLGNLPGLIMEAYDVGMQCHFKINGLQRVANEPIVFSKTYVGSMKFERTSRKKFLRLHRKYLSDINGYIYMETGIDLGNSEKKEVLGYDLLERDYKKYNANE